MPEFLPTTRADALARLDEFLPLVADYAETRNHVRPGHDKVSRLSPATRTRVMLEREILAGVREHHAPAAIEKFEQEVWWRLYWKGWLEQRPSVWKDYRRALATLPWNDRARAVAAGESGIAILDHFARELVETGYLHNHARMWWASWWVHGEGLPWQLGADFFLRHLRDGDAASNTLSWRWVAGLHTRGKAYLVRRSNLERYVEAGLLEKHRAGLDRLETIRERALPWEDAPAPRRIEEAAVRPGRRSGIWIHDEDLRIEESPLAMVKPVAIVAPAPVGIWEAEAYHPDKRAFLRAGLADGASRASAWFGTSAPLLDSDDLVGTLLSWAREEGLDTIHALKPCVGPLAEALPVIERALAAEGVSLNLVRRPEDVAVMNLARAGFFNFWEKVKGM